jgi:hypothetical protein
MDVGFDTVGTRGEGGEGMIKRLLGNRIEGEGREGGREGGTYRQPRWESATTGASRLELGQHMGQHRPRPRPE